MHGGGYAWQGGMCGRGRAWQGAYMAGGVHGRGHVWKGGMHGGGACVAGGGHAWHTLFRFLYLTYHQGAQRPLEFSNIFQNWNVKTGKHGAVKALTVVALSGVNRLKFMFFTNGKLQYLRSPRYKISNFECLADVVNIIMIRKAVQNQTDL